MGAVPEQVTLRTFVEVISGPVHAKTDYTDYLSVSPHVDGRFVLSADR